VTQTLRHWAATHPGTRRATNEDAYLCRPEIGLFAVADGVGGHGSGAFASAQAMKALEQIPQTASPGDVLVAVRTRLGSVHDALCAAAAEAGREDPPATTAVVLLLGGGHLACVWVGDSRAYLLRRGELFRLTTDHSVVGELVKAGRLTDAQAERRSDGHIITRALGVNTGGALLDKVTAPVEPGDRLLLCSDGLPRSVSSQVIGATMAADEPAAALVAAALAAGVRDNVTALVARV
jgi:serine/threonine protein phosphatase PrpC